MPHIENNIPINSPCAEKLKSFKTVDSVKIGRHRRDKHNCEHCGNRRFGYMCFVSFICPRSAP